MYLVDIPTRILIDDDVAVTSENLAWLFAKALQLVNMLDLVKNIEYRVGATPMVGGAPAAASSAASA
ncbi:unnamed protein product [Parnassius apollo]|uniref:(apollo) hypothetical protein n=1 Tax=Parnassius apollo TaxID=110799 RepID=A0A8S3X082_PARAO|nr:unnamed protein product [Parnassius apollo]